MPKGRENGPGEYGPRQRGARTKTENTRSKLIASSGHFVNYVPGFKVESVAADAGVSAATVYNHFPRRSLLVRAGVEASLGRSLHDAFARSYVIDDGEEQETARRRAGVMTVVSHFSVFRNGAINYYDAITSDVKASDTADPKHPEKDADFISPYFVRSLIKDPSFQPDVSDEERMLEASIKGTSATEAILRQTAYRPRGTRIDIFQNTLIRAMGDTLCFIP